MDTKKTASFSEIPAIDLHGDMVNVGVVHDGEMVLVANANGVFCCLVHNHISRLYRKVGHWPFIYHYLKEEQLGKSSLMIQYFVIYTRSYD